MVKIYYNRVRVTATVMVIVKLLSRLGLGIGLILGLVLGLGYILMILRTIRIFGNNFFRSKKYYLYN